MLHVRAHEVAEGLMGLLDQALGLAGLHIVFVRVALAIDIAQAIGIQPGDRPMFGIAAGLFRDYAALAADQIHEPKRARLPGVTGVSSLPLGVAHVDQHAPVRGNLGAGMVAALLCRDDALLLAAAQLLHPDFPAVIAKALPHHEASSEPGDGLLDERLIQIERDLLGLVTL